ncbi:hypothetical protein GCM10010106_20180 [Thermopolyspora flexuosa]|jgi:hypothetical protein|uniref:Uncharacterized protein DUF397 n=1 Tax=Thermopolyspora flexuosa TaxID=103836 RepID=A0A543J3K0_9ACTN|nr:DUF397 domain-containing protein [Thermopolyspora flexuosa]TQM77399.1 uncharacterized protein DUF397 [Thermopolyspora flexuosa]GGM73582.1 hypothetical protein GCM10010106_20180 [Thermopolyspora flexuosa]
MSPIDLTGAVWRKSVRSTNGNCVEVALLADGRVGIRDGKNPLGAVLAFSRAEWGAFVSSLKSGRIGA